MNSVKSLVLALCVSACLLLPNHALANSGTDFSNSGGTLSGTASGMSLTGSLLIAVSGYNGGGLVTGDLGSVSFWTGALSGGSLQMGGTFAAGGSFTIDGNGSSGVPNGVLFSGSFSGPVTWTLTTLANGTHNYTLTGIVVGTMGRDERQWSDRATYDQYRKRLFQRHNHDLRGRHQCAGFGTGTLGTPVVWHRDARLSRHDPAKGLGCSVIDIWDLRTMRPRKPAGVFF